LSALLRARRRENARRAATALQESGRHTECKRLSRLATFSRRPCRRSWRFIPKALRLAPGRARCASIEGVRMLKSSRSNGPALNRRELLRLSTAAGVGAVIPAYGGFADMKGGQSGVAAVT